MKKLIKIIKEKGIGFILTVISILSICLFQWIGIFDTFELKSYDYRFSSVRGPLTGWRASPDSTYLAKGTDIVIVEIDDEAWRLMPETWPYPRGTIWAKVIRNLYKAGAKVIAFDIQFDAPESKSEYLQNFAKGIESEELRELIPRHGDIILGEAVAEAQAFGTDVVINAKMVTDPNMQPPQYISYPVKDIMKSNPITGLINDQLDKDGFSRRYAIAGYLNGDLSVAYLTLALKCVQAYLDIPDTTIPRFDREKLIWTYGPLKIPSYGETNAFSVNYYGPASGIKILSEENFPAWGTYQRYSLAHVIDTKDKTLRDPSEDIDWMSQFTGEIPDWVKAIEDPAERQEMIEILGVGESFDITQSPFYNKIVVIGTTVETHHDFKQTPFYNYLGITQITPGVETHVNTIQTLLDENYIHVLGNRLTGFLGDYYPLSHGLLIALLSMIAFFLLAFVNPVLGGILIFLEVIIYFAVACGLFTQDLLWFPKSLLMSILPRNFLIEHYSWFESKLPGPSTSLMIPMIAPMVGVLATYTSNMLYQFINEQKNKRFLKSTFGAYISPELIDQMYEGKQEPKLGGDVGYHTAFFSDIQSFSSFSEVLEPEKMVSLMNQYLTEMTTVLLARNGTLDKYIGDAIVAFYGAPVPVEDHEFQACMTALDMKQKLVELREMWAIDGDWPDIVCNMQHRIGVGTGDLVTGNMGSTMRMNYTMMGDTVNLAARLESSAKQYGVYIQVSDKTYLGAKDHFEWRYLDYVIVKGKNVPVKVYELLAEKGQHSGDEAEAVALFHKGQELYLKQDWDGAKKYFEDADKLEDMFIGRSTNPSRIYIDRCIHLKENPPGKDWDGVWRLTAK